jgi:hypothetical protein
VDEESRIIRPLLRKFWVGLSAEAGSQGAESSAREMREEHSLAVKTLERVSAKKGV